MRARVWLALLLFLVSFATTASADQRFIVRADGLLSIQSLCAKLGCKVVGSLDGSLNQVFLVTTSDLVNPKLFLAALDAQPACQNAELDLLGAVLSSDYEVTVPEGLYDREPVSYFGTTVWRGYLSQPAAQIVRIEDARNGFRVTGAGIVAVIDTGVDPNHLALKNILVEGYDFTRDQGGSASELSDVNQSTMAVVDQAHPAEVNQSTMAVVDQSTMALVDNPKYAAFGHGTMVAGIIHLVAPEAKILPLKAFRADGTGYTSDILRAIYYAVRKGAKVINMSFSLPSYSKELESAVNFAAKNKVVSVASAGNDGKRILVYPAALKEVIGVASTTNRDIRSNFSNFGSDLVWVAAPGEGVITPYPFGTYAAVWGTSFSAPIVSGGVALLLDLSTECDDPEAADALSHAWYISEELGKGRVDLYEAVRARRQKLGLK